MRGIAAVLGAIALFAVTPALLVSAAPGPTGDQGLVGAKNMTNTNAMPGMTIGMTANLNGNGNLGMKCAVKITTGAWEPGSCNASGK